MAPAVDWDEVYRKGHHSRYWDLSRPSPELVSYMARPALTAPRRVLDVGCGSGRDAVFLAAVGHRVAALDLSPEAIELGRQEAEVAGVVVDWHVGNVLELPFAAASFDLVTDRGCLHHISDGDRICYAEQVTKVLAPGGRLFLRGCRRRQVPFIPLTEATIATYFPPPRFEPEQLETIDLVTDSGVLPGTLCALRLNPHHQGRPSPRQRA